MRRRRAKLLLTVLFATPILCFLLPRFSTTKFRNGARVNVVRNPVWRDIFPESNASIHYRPTLGKPVKIVLWEDLFDEPECLFPGRDSNVFYCLYNFDTCFCLFRIDANSPFQPVLTNSFLHNILFTSDCHIREATYMEWQEVMSNYYGERKDLLIGFGRNPSNILAQAHYPTDPPY